VHGTLGSQGARYGAPVLIRRPLLNQSRIAKTLARTAVVSWRDQPTQYDIEALRANLERVGLVIRVRWVIVAALAVFSVVAALVYGSSVAFDQLISNMTIPAIALLFVLMYNGFYEVTLRKVGNVAFLNQAQLIFDIVVTSVLVYYSGGVYSWFSSMYLLFILEGAFILPKRHHVWLLVFASATLYGFILAAEYWGWIPHVDMPFVDNGLYANATYVLVRYLWKVTLYAGAGTIGMLMMKRIHVRERELRESSFVDETTGLYNRQYFHRVLNAEVDRARRDRGTVGLILIDIYQFGEFNRIFGVEVGDEILSAIANEVRSVLNEGHTEDGYEVNVACRVGGEELAVIVPETLRYVTDADPAQVHVRALAEIIRERIEAFRMRGLGVTLSLGVAVAPNNGESGDTLLDAADRALYAASEAGGNQVVVAWETELEDPEGRV